MRAQVLGAAAALAMVAGGADAAVLSNVSNTALSASTPVTIVIPNSTATFVFNAVQTGYGPGAAVSTTGTGQVTTIFGGLADFESGSSFDGTGLYSYASYATPTAIPYSAADDTIGFSFQQADGVHYGYAEVFGPELVGYGYETTADTTIVAETMGGLAAAPVVGSTGGGTGGSGDMPMPEPGTLAVLAAGLAALGWSGRGRFGRGTLS